MAGTCTMTGITHISDGSREVAWTWLSDASGDVSGEGGITLSGIVLQVRFVSDTGDTLPTDLYAVTVVDSNSCDILQGTGATVNRLNATAASYRTPLTTDDGFVRLHEQAVSPVVAAAGAAKGGKIYLIVQ